MQPGYMNARYYVPNTNRWLSPDSIVPNPANPQSFNRYSYGYNNPVKYFDPSGHIACDVLGTEACTEDGKYVDTQPQEKQYDMTEWLASEMVINANGSEMAEMRSILQRSYNSNTYNGSTGMMPDTRFLEVLFGPFYQLNTGKGLWDIKRLMKTGVAEGITLCGNDGCGWFDYSVPGNIHYGFVAAAIGVPRGVSLVAGGYVEIKEGTWVAANILTFFEDPRDYAAVEFGYQLYETYGPDMTVGEFRTALTADVRETFQPPPSDFPIPGPARAQENGYLIGAFNYQGG